MAQILQESISGEVNNIPARTKEKLFASQSVWNLFNERYVWQRVNKCVRAASVAAYASTSSSAPTQFNKSLDSSWSRCGKGQAVSVRKGRRFRFHHPAIVRSVITVAGRHGLTNVYKGALALQDAVSSLLFPHYCSKLLHPFARKISTSTPSILAEEIAVNENDNPAPLNTFRMRSSVNPSVCTTISG